MADKKISALPVATTPLAGTEVLPIVQGGTTDQVSVANLTTGRAVSSLSVTTTQDVTTGRNIVVTGAGTIEQNGAAGGLYFANSAVSAGATNMRFYTTNASGTAQIQYQLNGGTTPTNQVYGDLIAETGNFKPGTSGKGIDFSATPNLSGMTSELFNDYEEGTFIPTLSGATTTTYTTQTGRYTRIGRQIFFHCELQINSLGNGSSTIVLLGDLPTAATAPYSTISVGFFTGIASTVSSLMGYIGAAGANSVQFQSLLVAATATAPNAVFANGSRVMFSGQYTI